MVPYIISCCSAADLKADFMKEHGIECLSFTYMLGKEWRTDDLFTSITADEFYNRMKAGDDTKTSALNANDYIVFFEPFLKNGQDILHVTLSSGLSSTYQSACLAASALLESYPDRTIRIIDSLGACNGIGLLCLKLCEARDEGKTINEAFSLGESIKLHVHHEFMSSDLTFYIKGGRVSKAAGFIAGALNICPVLDMDTAGGLSVRGKVRPKKKAVRHLLDMMLQHCDNGTDYDDICLISHSQIREDAENLKSMIEENFPRLRGRILINDIGPTIGAHSGPGTLAVFFMGDMRTPAEEK